jgi:hypothetical protein
MVRRKRLQGAQAFEQVRRQAGNLVVSLRGEIRVKEAELNRLKDEEAALSRLGRSASAAAARVGRPVRGGKASRRRVDWGSILQQLPKQFKAADIRAVSVVKKKRASEIFAAITRWIEAGTVKRKARGVYARG